MATKIKKAVRVDPLQEETGQSRDSLNMFKLEWVESRWQNVASLVVYDPHQKDILKCQCHLL